MTIFYQFQHLYLIRTIYVSDPKMKPIYIFCFFKAVHSYLIQLFGIFQSKLSGSIMDFDLDIVNPEEQEEGLEWVFEKTFDNPKWGKVKQMQAM